MTFIHTLKHKLAPVLLVAALAITAVALPVGATTSQGSTASITFSGGDLILVSADRITFEPGVVTSIDTEYDAIESVDVVISDNRGSEDGWQLTAKLGVFSIGGTQALQNATITVSDVSIEKINQDNLSATPTVSPTVTLISGGAAAPVATAAAGQGGGGWTVSFDEAGIELAVKADTAREGLATAQIDWVIADAL